MFARCPCIPSFIANPVVDEVEPELTPDTTTRHPFDRELVHVPGRAYSSKCCLSRVRDPTIVSVKVDLFVYRQVEPGFVLASITTVPWPSRYARSGIEANGL